MIKKLEYLVIHCTATPEGRVVTAEDIRRWHLSPAPVGRGWKQVGYSDLILLDGTIVNLVPENNNDNVEKWLATNGVQGKNSVSRHICYVGGLDLQMKAKDTRTDAQKESMKKYVLDFMRKHPTVKVVGHNEFFPKSCPSFDVKEWLKTLN